MGYRVAIASSDGDHVASCISQAGCFAVFEVRRGRITGWELRTDQAMGTPLKEGKAGDKVGKPCELLVDCRAVICGDVSDERLRWLNDRDVQVLKTQLSTVEDAAKAYLRGMLHAYEPTSLQPPRDRRALSVDWVQGF